MMWAARLDRLVGAIVSWGRWLALPVVLLLFLQWPLRDIFPAYSREANDLGQWLFALYVAMSFTAATRARTHLAADVLAQGYPPKTRSLIWRLGVLIALVPWALFVLIAGKSIVLPSVAVLERFPDTYNPGYFLIKLALWVLAGLIFAQAVVDILLRIKSGAGLLLTALGRPGPPADGMARHRPPGSRRRRHRADRAAGRLRAHRGRRTRRNDRGCERHDPASPADRLDRPSGQSVRERSAAGAAALRHDGAPARPPAGRRRALPREPRGAAARTGGAARFRHGASARCSGR